MLDISRLCPGCMREAETDRAAGMQGGKMRREGKCPHCGFEMSGYKQNARCLPVNTILAGKYLVGAALGQGGFGITYMGYDLNMQARIAIKEYFPVELVSRDTTSLTGDRVVSFSGDKGVTYRQGLKKYVEEAQNVSRFSEVPGVVSVKDFFYENETAYIVMEYIEGISLKEYLKERGGRLQEEETLAIMKPVLEALEKVHEAGIVHRDISPDNIMLTFAGGRGRGAAGGGVSGPGMNSKDNCMASGDGAGDRWETVCGSMGIVSVRLIDFGAARMTAKNDQKSLTIILKHGYAPEEQYRTHGEQGAWTDVYAVCAVMYRMLAGQTPVPAMDRLFRDELKALKDLGAEVSANTAFAIQKGLAVRKEDRMQNMQELIAALYEGEKMSADGKLTRAGKWAVIGGAAAAAVAGIVLFGMSAKKSEGQSPEALSAQMADAGVDGDNAPDRAVGEALPKDVSFSDAGTQMTEGGGAEEGTVLGFEEAGEEFGEVIVTPAPQTSYDSGTGHVVILKEDGTVTTLGNNGYGQRNLSEWSRIAAVAAGSTFSAGLREDGKVVVAGELYNKENVERWEGITAISAEEGALYGLRADGKVVGNYYDRTSSEAAEEWSGIKAIYAADSQLFALTEEGGILSAGAGYTPAGISGWEDVRYITGNYKDLFGIKGNGDVVYAPKWSDLTDSDPIIENLGEFHGIVQLFVTNHAVFGVDESGRLYVSGNHTLAAMDTLSQVAEWEDLCGVTGDRWGDGRMAGIRKDGTILKISENFGNAQPETMAGLEKVFCLDGIDNQEMTLVGIPSEGELLYYSVDAGAERIQGVSGAKEVCELRYRSENGAWKVYAYLDTVGNLWVENSESFHKFELTGSNLQQIVCSRNSPESYIVGLSMDGTVQFYQTGCYGVSDDLKAAEGWKEITQLAGYQRRDSSRYGILGLRSDGTVESIRWDGSVQPEAADWSGIVSLHPGKYAVGAIRSDGTPVFMEDGQEYNYGQYNTAGWTDLKQLALGLYHTAGLKADGTVYATGRNDAGQCEVEDWTDIVYIAASDSCTFGIRSDGTLVMAGDLGW